MHSQQSTMLDLDVLIAVVVVAGVELGDLGLVCEHTAASGTDDGQAGERDSATCISGITSAGRTRRPSATLHSTTVTPLPSLSSRLTAK
jgi:hypothetical protein